MKTKIKLLLTLICISLSCNHLTESNRLNTNPNNKTSPSKPRCLNKRSVQKSKNKIKINQKKVSLTTGDIFNAMDHIASSNPSHIQIRQISILINKYLEDIKQHNAADYRFKSDSRSNLYSEQWSKHAKHHNKFFDYINLLNTTSSGSASWANQVKSILAVAVFSKSPRIVLDFIECLKKEGIKIDIHAKNLFGMSVLHYAISSGDTKMVKVLIEEAPLVHIDGKDKALDFPDLLDQAICLGTTEIVKLLIDAGANPNLLYEGEQVGQHGYAFKRTVVYDRKDMAMYFIKDNLIKNWDQQDKYGHTALIYVASSSYPEWAEILHTLLQKGAAIETKDKDGLNVCMHLLRRYDDMHKNANTYHEYYSNHQDKNIYQNLLKDKQEMLNCLSQHNNIF